MSNNRIYITTTSHPIISISGLTRAEFDRLTIEGGSEKTYDENGTPNYFKNYMIRDEDGAFLNLTFGTTEPPIAVVSVAKNLKGD